MPHDPIGVDDFALAQAVIDKVRIDIKKSFTGLTLSGREVGKSGKSDTRKVGHNYDAMMFGAIKILRDVTKATPIEKMVRVDPDDDLAYIEKKIAMCRKYSIGNCLEYATLVLDEIWRHSREQGREIKAEIFHIKNGDHVFVVIGRDPKTSIEKDPKTWGNAIIVDAWSGMRYYAKEYEKKLRNYVYSSGKSFVKGPYQESMPLPEDSKHYTEPFNSGKHILEPQLANSETLNKRVNPHYVEEMNQVFKHKVEVCKRELEIYKDKLRPILSFLEKEYGRNHEKVKILRQKIETIGRFLLEKFDSKLISSAKITTYKDKNVLEKKLSALLQEIFVLSQYSADEIKILNQPNNETKILFLKLSANDTKEIQLIKIAFESMNKRLEENLSEPNENILRKLPKNSP